jgi:hypothetical protein
LRERDERFLTREELCERWRLSISELRNKEKSHVLKPHHFSYKVIRYRLSDILEIEEEAAKAD